MGTYQVIYQRHAVERMAQRGVSEEDVMHVLLTGESIQVYADDTPFPSELILGWRDGRPLHIIGSHRFNSATEDCNNRL